ncbi:MULTISPECIES: nitroreductase [Comamonas]|uniref:NADH dehydrogenase n=1 Tax=Comamonas testosteroni TaxID=285 RepID=A0A096FKE4_COMTE|nr:MULTISPECIES: nitroreductase [Comamonas]KGH30203.1 NADH dehydrogenase [Comamonas testosteroni]MPT12691.1 nitroreductase [Comamonas sp.]
MNVEQAMQQRHSVRAFLPRTVDAALVRDLLAQAGQAASGGNLQPWRVIALTGDSLQALRQAMPAATPDCDAALVYPAQLWEPYRSRRFDNGEELYRSIGIGREDRSGRQQQLARNTHMFGAPVGVFTAVDSRMLHAQWVDLGIYLQSLMLLATGKGLATCAQGFWRNYSDFVSRHLALPQGYQIAFGMALGYEDSAAPINQWRSTRAGLGDWCEMPGFE